VARSARHEVSVALHPPRVLGAPFFLWIYQALYGYNKLAELAIMGWKEEIGFIEGMIKVMG